MVSVLVWQQKMAVMSSNAVAQKAVQVLQLLSTLNKDKDSFRLLLAFGSNLEPREQNLKSALQFIGQYSYTLQSSQWKDTAPLKDTRYQTSHHEYYTNFILEVLTDLHPYNFYHSVIVKIEDQLGHSRHSKWMPRALDIDVVFAAKNDAIFFGDCTPVVTECDGFFVPHLEYDNRKFWREMIEVELNYVPKR